MIPTSAVIQHRNVHNMFFSWIFAHLQKIMNPMEKSTHEAKQIKGNLSIMPDTQKGSKGQNAFATRRANNQKE